VLTPVWSGRRQCWRACRQVTCRAVFPSVIPPPFFNSLIATLYSYRSPPPHHVTGSDVTEAASDVTAGRPQYYAGELVDWVRVDRVGCVDCDETHGSDCDAVRSHDESSLCHHVLIELLAQSRVIQVSVARHSTRLEQTTS